MTILSLQNRGQQLDLRLLSQVPVGNYKMKGKVVGNKAKERISKRMLLENKARQIFPKTNISYPLIRFSENLRFALLPYNRQVPQFQVHDSLYFSIFQYSAAIRSRLQISLLMLSEFKPMSFYCL